MQVQHHRRSIRLKEYDYSRVGAYFVTLCAGGKACVFEDAILKGIATDVWYGLPTWFPNIDLDEFVVMPNHIHFIVWLNDVGAPLADGPWEIPIPTKVNLHRSLGDVVGVYKSLTFKVYLEWIKEHHSTRRAKFWQRNYYERIVRDMHDLSAIQDYIRSNPMNWELDHENPALQNAKKDNHPSGYIPDFGRIRSD